MGTEIEWLNGDDALHTVTATSAPPGGTVFDSGTLGLGGRFVFVPNVAGTWKYVDQIEGAAATLTAE